MLQLRGARRHADFISFSCGFHCPKLLWRTYRRGGRPLSQELAQELWDAANSWVARDLTNMVVAEEAAIAAECLSLREKALEDVCDDLMTTTVDRECAVVAAECLEDIITRSSLCATGSSINWWMDKPRKWRLSR